MAERESLGVGRYATCPKCGRDTVTTIHDTVICVANCDYQEAFGAGEGSRPSSPVAPDGPDVSRCTCGRPITDPCWECCDK